MFVEAEAPMIWLPPIFEISELHCQWRFETAPDSAKQLIGRVVQVQRNLRTEYSMTNKPSPPVDSNSSDKHQGMMGDGTEEQNLNQPGTTGARIKKDEVTRLSKRKRLQNLEAVYLLRK
jgi:hypothetical protein